MNLLLINYEYPPIGAGAANATYYMAKSFAEAGHQVVVLTAGYKEKIGYEFENGVHVYRVPSRREKISSSSVREMLSYLWQAKKQLGNVVKKHKIEKAIIFFSIPCGVLGPILLKKHNVPYIISLRGSDVPGMEKGIEKTHQVITPIRRKILKNAKAIIANSKGLALASELVDPYRVHVVPNGVDTEFFSPILKEKNDTFTFLYVGRLQIQKNLIYTLSVFAESFKNKKIKLKLIGDGPQRIELMQLVEKLGISSQVEFMNWANKQELKENYQKSDCLINYSLGEGMPNVVLEAMACSLPVIASDIMGHDELVENGLTGYLVKLHDADDLAKKMKIITQEHSSCIEMGKKSRIKILDKYSWKSVINQYKLILND
jgi:glycosyltransferase involved in cell wall biosynthesis